MKATCLPSQDKRPSSKESLYTSARLCTLQNPQKKRVEFLFLLSSFNVLHCHVVFDVHRSIYRAYAHSWNCGHSWLRSSKIFSQSPAYCNFGPKGSLQVRHSPSATRKALGQRPRFVGPFQSSTQIGDAKLQPWHCMALPTSALFLKNIE